MRLVPGIDQDSGRGKSRLSYESAILLAEARQSEAARGALPLRGGVATPASALGERLIERLQAAGIRFETVLGPA